ncbi:molybdopterin cofactor-binding domain-containing protein, partial [Clostridioides difficile]|uniref:molybdopterin cofactor-binding domain-containing protein n=1 Tax=Clostridioides difficile TaxID=1496 RepID=UPI001F2E4AB7
MDTDACTFNLGEYASRGVYVEGGGAKKTAEKLKNLILEEEEKLLETSKEDLYLDNGCVISKLEEKVKASLSDVVVYRQSKSLRELTVVEDYSSLAGRTSYGVHFAEVLVDKETKDIK